VLVRPGLYLCVVVPALVLTITKFPPVGR